MGKLQCLEVVFDGNNDVFKPGDTIGGCVRILLNGEKGDIRGIKVVCKGKSYTHWSETHGSGDNRRTVHYSWKVKFFKQEIVLRGAGKNNKAASRMVLPAGDHRFPFQFQIPRDHLPPPFEGTVGWVRYYIKTTIDRPWKYDHHVTRFFSIFTVKDLNAIPNILSSPTSTTQKTVCCLCCESGPITVRASLDKGGYVPGENILVSIELDNQCGRELVSLKATLYQKAIYRAKHSGSTHTRKNTKKIAEISFPNVNEQQTQVIDKAPLAIPAIPPNTFENCPNIELLYVVKIEADVSGTPIDATVAHPVIIGTVPAFPYLVNYYGQHGQPAQVTYPPPPQGQQPPPAGAYPPPAQGGYPPPQPGYPAAQPGYPPPDGQAAAGYPPPQGGPPAGGYPPPQGYPVPPAGAYSEPSAPMLPPPSYEMAVEGPQEIEGKKGAFGSAMYAPQYPFYNPQILADSASQFAGAPSGGPGAGAPVTAQPQAGYPPQQPQPPAGGSGYPPPQAGYPPPQAGNPPADPGYPPEKTQPPMEMEEVKLNE